MTTIRIADDVNSPRAQDEGVTSGVGDSIYQMRPLARSATGDRSDDGIYNIRSVSRSKGSRLGRATSMDARSISSARDIEDDDPGLRREGDYKTKQVRYAQHTLPNYCS